MNWKNIIKAKYQGPRTEEASGTYIRDEADSEGMKSHKRMIATILAHKGMVAKLKKTLRDMSFPIDRLNESTDIPQGKELKELLDKADEYLLEMAKYGLGMEELFADRRDSKFLSQHGARYAPERNF